MSTKFNIGDRVKVVYGPATGYVGEVVKSGPSSSSVYPIGVRFDEPKGLGMTLCYHEHELAPALSPAAGGDGGDEVMVAPLYPLGSPENPYRVRRVAQDEANYKFCRCHKCDIVAVCTFMFDFYGELGEPLTCERCLIQEICTTPPRASARETTKGM